MGSCDCPKSAIHLGSLPFSRQTVTAIYEDEGRYLLLPSTIDNSILGSRIGPTLTTEESSCTRCNLPGQTELIAIDLPDFGGLLTLNTVFLVCTDESLRVN